MDEQKRRKAYIGIIKNENFDSKALVTAVNEDEAKVKVLEKYKADIGVYFQEEEVVIIPFAEGYK